ncbi:MAG: ATP-binding protein [Phycisphaerales bacterium JB063]
MPQPSDVVAGIQKRPAMYIGDTNEHGIRQLIFELVANGIDQFLAGRATQVSVDFRNDLEISVVDDGPGLPAYGEDSDAIDQWFMHYHNSPSATGHAPHVHLSHLGSGLVVINALSESLEVTSTREQQAWTLKFSRGELVNKQRTNQPNTPPGCRYRFIPDREIFQSARPRESVLRSMLLEAVHLHPGLTIGFRDERFRAASGMGDLIQLIARNTGFGSMGYRDPFHFRKTLHGVSINAAAMGCAQDDPTYYLSWANGIRTPGHGDHHLGLHDALSEMGWKPSAALISVIFHDARFAGPTRDRLIAPHVREIVRNALAPAMESFRIG